MAIAEIMKPNVLVVEDEELMRSILRQLLESEGFNVFTADSAENALEFFRQTTFP
jgi:CheY-like chemotaxis protein